MDIARLNPFNKIRVGNVWRFFFNLRKNSASPRTQKNFPPILRPTKISLKIYFIWARCENKTIFSNIQVSISTYRLRRHEAGGQVLQTRFYLCSRKIKKSDWRVDKMRNLLQFCINKKFKGRLTNVFFIILWIYFFRVFYLIWLIYQKHCVDKCLQPVLIN